MAGMDELGTETKAPSVSKVSERQAEMDAMMAAATPGEPHARLGQFVGSWTVNTKAWMSPDEPANESVGSSEARMILGGRFLEEKMTGSMGEMSYEGLLLMGYDNFAKRYNFFWIDNMGTMMLTGDGDWDLKTNSLHGSASFVDPANGKPTNMRLVMRADSKAKRTFEMYMSRADEKVEAKVMESVYSKR